MVTLAILGTIFLQAPQPTLTVDELIDDKSKHLDKEVAVRGEIRDGSINESTMTFILEGSEFISSSIIQMPAQFPMDWAITERSMQRDLSVLQMESLLLKRMSSRLHVHQNMKSRLDQYHRLAEIESVVGLFGIGGELGVPCTTNRLYGGLNALGRRKRLMGSCMRTLMSRPHMIGCCEPFPEGNGNQITGEQVRPGTEHPYLGPWVLWGSGMEEVCGYGLCVRASPEDSHLDVKYNI